MYQRKGSVNMYKIIKEVLTINYGELSAIIALPLLIILSLFV